jgi:hypothetical protein
MVLCRSLQFKKFSLSSSKHRPANLIRRWIPFQLDCRRIEECQKSPEIQNIKFQLLGVQVGCPDSFFILCFMPVYPGALGVLVSFCGFLLCGFLHKPIMQPTRCTNPKHLDENSVKIFKFRYLHPETLRHCPKSLHLWKLSDYEKWIKNIAIALNMFYLEVWN